MSALGNLPPSGCAAVAAFNRVVDGALALTPDGLRSAVEMVDRAVRIVEADHAYDDGDSSMALLAMYGIVHRALFGGAADDPPETEEGTHHETT
ncbi:MAG: hypothetical protein Q8L45_01580 [Xanthomonadaceae bacterium]|nr:hypothetical protein [Xanthomonadaceae bacterium]MDP2185049.1 hypothetical protein [Xanthomonadales bacterium]MDZ4114428.1 hypothetical protein [Xanthomonadaceae bacterium]